MSKVVSYYSHDYVPALSVPVIASFDSEGHIAPLYVRLEGVSCKIDSYWVKSNCVNIIQFSCQVIDHNIRKPLMLYYYQDECMWTIRKA